LPHVETKPCFQHHFPINSIKKIQFTFTYVPCLNPECEVSQENKSQNTNQSEKRENKT
jgi:hypothetical protein